MIIEQAEVLARECVPVKSNEYERELTWDNAAERGLLARQEREKIVKSVLKPELDFGIIPGTDKPTLLKPGAEKIADSLNLWCDYEELTVIQDFDRNLFFYRYRCVMKTRGTNAPVATGIGSCSSREAKYRWRNAERVCPTCGKAAIIKGRAEYGGGWLCFKKKGGCGAKFPEDSPEIVHQTLGRVENDDVGSTINTIDKMAQKRAIVAAALNLGFSEHFTQDLEDDEHGDASSRLDASRQQPRLDAETSRVIKQWSQWLGHSDVGPDAVNASLPQLSELSDQQKQHVKALIARYALKRGWTWDRAESRYIDPRTSNKGAVQTGAASSA